MTYSARAVGLRAMVLVPSLVRRPRGAQTSAAMADCKRLKASGPAQRPSRVFMVKWASEAAFATLFVGDRIQRARIGLYAYRVVAIRPTLARGACSRSPFA